MNVRKDIKRVNTPCFRYNYCRLMFCICRAISWSDGPDVKRKEAYGEGMRAKTTIALILFALKAKAYASATPFKTRRASSTPRRSC